MVKLKTPELTYAKRALIKFVETNDLNPAKDYSNHPVYGKEYKELLLKLNLERDKVLKKYPLTDLKNLKKLSKMKKGLNLKREKKVVEQMPDSTKKKKKASKENVAKEEKKAPRTPAKKYDYPLVDGREMTADEKKKYRQEQRKLANGDNKPKAKKDKVEKKEKVEKVNKKSETPSEKKSKKADKEEKKEKKGLKVIKKGKKSKKDED